jgi:hypothetical protein
MDRILITMDTQKKHNCAAHDHHEGHIVNELMHHLPYAIFSVALGLIILSFLDVFGLSHGHHHDHAHHHEAAHGAHLLFHSFHFLHIIFAMTGCLVMFSRFSKNLVKGAIVAVISSFFFCTLSDVILPYLSGTLLGVNMHFHICLVSELHNVIPFYVIGLVNGLIMSKHNSAIKGFYSVGSHFGHILISSLASLFYLISEGFSNWYPQMGLLFLFLVVAVVVPCTLADVIVPIFFARPRKNNEKYQAREYHEVV